MIKKILITLALSIYLTVPAFAQRTVSIKYLNDLAHSHRQDAIETLSLPATSKEFFFYVNSGKLFIHCIGEHGEYDFLINDCELLKFLEKVE